MYVTMYVTLYNIADTNSHEAKKKTLALQGFLVEVAGFEPAAFWSRTISKARKYRHQNADCMSYVCHILSTIAFNLSISSAW